MLITCQSARLAAQATAASTPLMALRHRLGCMPHLAAGHARTSRQFTACRAASSPSSMHRTLGGGALRPPCRLAACSGNHSSLLGARTGSGTHRHLTACSNGVRRLANPLACSADSPPPVSSSDRHKFALLEEKMTTAPEERAFWQEKLNKCRKQSTIQAASFVDLEWKTGIRPVWVNRKRPNCFEVMQYGKIQHPTAITLVRVGPFYEAAGVDAIMLHEHCGLNFKGAAANLQATSAINAAATAALRQLAADLSTDKIQLAAALQLGILLTTLPAHSSAAHQAGWSVPLVGSLEQQQGAVLSAFKVEMKEMATVLSDARPSSLVLVDELGKGTEVVSGTGIASGILRKLADRGAMGIFATHLHLLVKLLAGNPNILQYKMEVVNPETGATTAAAPGEPAPHLEAAAGHMLSEPGLFRGTRLWAAP